MKESDKGCVLRLLPLGENGLIVYWCTEGHGILHTAARNARKPGSDFAGRLDLFHECELLISRPARGDLYTLHSVGLLNPRLALRSTLPKLCLASYMARLLMATVEPDTAGEEWHKLISGALDYLADNPARAAVLHHFEKRLATLHGLFNAAMPPHQSLLQHFQHLPSGRNELLQQLSKV